ncbi:MAG TPA: DUF4097 family beta strand repeat-containing protein [Gemmatimonadaceae bacterium]
MLRKIALTIALLPTLAAAQDRSGDQLFTWSGQVASGQTFSVRHFNGPIDVREGTGDRVEFRADRRTRRSADLTFEVEKQGDGVMMCAVYDGRSACDDGRSRGWNWRGNDGPPSTRLTITLPKGVRLDAVTGNGAVTVDKASNDVRITTGNGDVRISLTAGDVEVTSGNGDLEIDGATGPVRAGTGNGRVYVTTSSGPVNARTGNGMIDVRMKAITGNGDMTFATGNGPITVALPDTFNGEIDATTGHGDFRSDFPIRISGRLSPSRVRGTIGTGGRMIRMSTGNGSLELRKS